MFLVEILLPLRDEQGQQFPPGLYDNLAQQLTHRFGGVTAFSRSPAEGRWKSDAGTEHDDIVVLEVMAESLDRQWWSQLRKDLMGRFRQEDIVIRSHEIERL